MIAAAKIPYHRSNEATRVTVALLMPGRTAQNSAQMIPKMAKIKRWWPTASNRSRMAEDPRMCGFYHAYSELSTHSPETKCCPRRLTEMVCVLLAKQRLLHFSCPTHRQRVQENDLIRYPPFRNTFGEKHQNL